jgi:hypothetical protein
MAEFIHEHSAVVADARGNSYRAFVLGEERVDGTWESWIEFRPEGAGGATLSTERETTQPNREALVYWATGLEPTHLEGALARAR